MIIVDYLNLLNNPGKDVIHPHGKEKKRLKEIKDNFPKVRVSK